jgi:hypothetical protein
MAVGVALAAGPGAAAETDLINAQTPWRAYLVTGPVLQRQDGKLMLLHRRPIAFEAAGADPLASGFSPPPDAAWMQPAFNASCWARYAPEDLRFLLDKYGTPRPWGSQRAPALLCLRTAFGVADPARATDLTVTVECLGGAVVYVNGREVGRGSLPEGAILPLAPAEDYPIEAYTAEDGTTPLPQAKYLGGAPDDQFRPRYERRVRRITVRVPSGALVKGRNVLAVEVHQAPVSATMGRYAWAHLGVGDIRLASASGAGVIPYAEALKGVRLWSASPEQQVTDVPSQDFSRGMGHKVIHWMRALSVQGIQVGNPFDPVRPVRLAVPRNGVGSGQVVVTDLGGLRGVAAKMGALKGPSGDLPARAVEVLYAVQPEDFHVCDALMPKAPDGARTVPVWVIVTVPKDQAPGWYVGRLSVTANGQDFGVPVQVLVAGAAVPDAKDFTSCIGAASSYETVALHYGVKPWSAEHFRLIEPGLRMLGQLGNDVLHVPVITQNQFRWGLPLVRFRQEGGALAPDFTVLEKYLDLYAKYCAPPRALCLYVWDANCAKRGANSYENRQIPSRAFQPRMTLSVALVDPRTGETSEVPAPHFADPGAEGFYKRLVGGVAAILARRGWPKEGLMLSLGGDNRPSIEDSALLDAWLPGVRWDLLSHFSGDAGAFGRDKEANELLKTGKFIALGGLEVGLKEHPWRAYQHPYTAVEIEKDLASNRQYLDLGTARWHWQDYSPPLVFRTLPMLWGHLGRVGLDFWKKGGAGTPFNHSYFTAGNAVTVPGAGGAEPTVRFQMMREGVQDMELRLMIVRGCAKLAEERRQPYRDLLDEFPRRLYWSGDYLSQHELGWDWRAYAAKVQAAAAELAGAKTDATWQSPPG